MLKTTRRFLIALFPMLAVCFMASAQENKEPDLNEFAEKEAERLERILDLESWQVFYVDSTLKHDYAALQADIEALKSSKVYNSSMYLAVQDKWMDQIDASYRKYFNDKQWAAYLKSGAAKLQKQREKRRAGATAKKK